MTAAYEIEFTSSAERAFRRLPPSLQRRFSAAFEVLRIDPRRRRPGCDVRLLSGAANAWRLRVGDYRGIYAIEGSKIVFTRFGHRKDVYRP
ncbi:MAG: type II toxin-antitoxin system RelE family toxin [Thermoplasmata archaeon]